VSRGDPRICGDFIVGETALQCARGKAAGEDGKNKVGARVAAHRGIGAKVRVRPVGSGGKKKQGSCDVKVMSSVGRDVAGECIWKVPACRVTADDYIAQIDSNVFDQVSITGDSVDESGRERVPRTKRRSRGKTVFESENASDFAMLQKV